MLGGPHGNLKEREGSASLHRRSEQEQEQDGDGSLNWTGASRVGESSPEPKVRFLLLGRGRYPTQLQVHVPRGPRQAEGRHSILPPGRILELERELVPYLPALPRMRSSLLST